MRRSPISARGGRAQAAILIGLVIVLVGIGVWWWTRPATRPGNDAGRAVAESFLKEVREGRAAGAWESTTAEFKSALGKERFLREAQALPFLKGPLEFVSVADVDVQHQSRLEYTFRAAAGEIVRLVIGREGNVWKVDRWRH